MPVFVIDNGEQWSSHEIYFRQSDYTKEEAELVLKWSNKHENDYDGKKSLLGIFDKVTWWKGKIDHLYSEISLDMLLGIKYDDDFNIIGYERSEYLDKLPKQLIQQAVQIEIGCWEEALENRQNYLTEAKLSLKHASDQEQVTKYEKQIKERLSIFEESVEVLEKLVNLKF